MIFRRTKSLVGLDIGSSAVKAIELRQVSSGYKGVAIGSEPVPADCIVDGVIIDGGAVANNGLSYTWNFGDGQIVTETIPNITYAFVDDSTRNVVLTVTDIAGNSAPTTMTVDPEP